MNKKLFCISIIFLLFAHCIIAQSRQEMDSLKGLLQRTPSDTGKAMILYQLSDKTKGTDTAASYGYIRQGIELSKKYPYYRGVGYYYLGRMYTHYEPDKSEAITNQSLSLLEKVHTPASYAYQSSVWGIKAIAIQIKGDEEAYADLVQSKVIPLAVKAGDSLRVAYAYTQLTNAFMNTSNWDKAILYAQKSVAIHQRHQPFHLHQTTNFANLAKIQLLKKAPATTAKVFLDSAFRIMNQNPDAITYEPYYYAIEAQYYIYNHQKEQADQSINKGIAAAQKINSRTDIRSLLYQKARLYRQQNNKKAEKEVLLTLVNEGYMTTVGDRKLAYRGLATTEAGLNNMGAAYKWLSEYSRLSDSLSSATEKRQIAELETKYNFVQKEKDLLVANNKARRQKMLTGISLAGLLLALLLFLYLNKIRKYKAAQQLHSLKQEQEIALTQALLDGEEKERMRMARDLHDGLGGMLAGVKINLTNVLEDEPSKEINRVILQLDNSVTELRRIARNMMPEALLRSGLETALTDLCQSISGEKLSIEHSFMNISTRISQQEQTIIYRIVQELLTNVVRHAAATEAFVQCSQNGNLFSITVEDNGRGMAAANQAGHRGIGLDNIRSRVEFLKGKIELQSTPGKGTIINIELVLNEKE